MVAPQKACKFTLHLNLVRSIDLRIVRGIGRIKPDQATILVDVFERSLLTANQPSRFSRSNS